MVAARRWLLLLAGAACAPLVGCGGSGDDLGSTSSTPGGTSAASAYAAERLTPTEIEGYQAAGERLELDWTVLAAVDQIEGNPGSPDEAAQRAESIGYSLIATGAPSKYQVALEARGGSSPAFARKVLDLARQYAGSSAPTADPPIGDEPLLAPTDGRIVSAFGRGFGVLHNGIDIAGATGDPIAAIAPGVVLNAGFNPAYGNYTCIAHQLSPPIEEERRVTSCYGNQSAYQVEVGDTVARGETIGLVGCSGPCLRPHVHLQILLGGGTDGRAIDPVPLFDGELGEVGDEPALEG